jgi:glycosyltransferase involved in cell wall biosynthesis
MSPEVTVLMSVYNGERYLRESIESILNQTFSDFEFLIINDGSTDSSREIILSYDDPRIILVDNEENMGLAKSLNGGIHRARGEYIARQDADDISHPLRFEKEFEHMKKNKCDVVCCRYQYIDKRGKKLRKVSDLFYKENIFQLLVSYKDPIAHGSVLMKKNVLQSVGEYNELLVYAQDFELWLRLLNKRKKIECVDYVGYFFRYLTSLNREKKQYFNKIASLIINNHNTRNSMFNNEIASFNDSFIARKKQEYNIIFFFVAELNYWYNIMKIQLKGMLS